MILDKINEQLRGESDYDTLTLLREARAEILRLQQEASDQGWRIDYLREEAERLERRNEW